VGTLAAAVVLPVWLPGLSRSLLGAEPQAYWYLSRASGFVAYGLLWLSMVLGLLITNRAAKLWPGGPLAFDLHQYTSLLGLAFALFHGLILLGDQYMDYTLVQLLVPFASMEYKPLAVGIGQLAFWLLLLLALSFYARQQIGRQVWRALHLSSFAVFLLALLHGITSGTDSGTAWAAWLYWISGGSVLFLTVYRVLSARM
jgi:predicted ferric reductase